LQFSLTISITRSHLRRGIPGNPGIDPIALALWDIPEFAFPCIGNTGGEVVYCPEGEERRWMLMDFPFRTQAFIVCYDATPEIVEPEELIINFRDSWEKPKIY